MSSNAMEMPAVNDHLVVEHGENRGRTRVDVRVTQTWRYRFAVEAVAGGYLPYYLAEWDVRDRGPYGDTYTRSATVGDVAYWERRDARTAAWDYLGGQGIHPGTVRGPLARAIDTDPTGFEAVVRQFIKEAIDVG